MSLSFCNPVLDAGGRKPHIFSVILNLIQAKPAASPGSRVKPVMTKEDENPC